VRGLDRTRCRYELFDRSEYLLSWYLELLDEKQEEDSCLMTAGLGRGRPDMVHEAPGSS
jgi:hypothetical protein